MSIVSPRKSAEAPSSWGPATTGPLNPTAFPQLATPVSRLVTGFVQPRALSEVLDGLSSGCKADDAKQNEGVAAWLADAGKHGDAQCHAFDGAETVTLEMLRSRRDKIDAAELSLSQRAVVLQRGYVGRSEVRAGELKVHAESAADELKSTEESVVKGLNTAGVSVETQPAHPHNCEAAKHTFNLVVRQSSEWRAANEKLGTAQANHAAAVEAVTAGKLRVGQAEKHLATVVKRLAGICA